MTRPQSGSGPSTIISGQGQYAQAWYLAATTTPWGDAVGYRYNDWPRGGDGLIPIVEQLVGDADGLPYTKACYLTGITDVFGRTVTKLRRQIVERRDA